jgi:cell wall-associated NlpC family hydrolase
MLGNSLRDIEMRMRQQAQARRRGMVNDPDRKRDNGVSSTQKAIDDITAQTMQRLAGQGITRTPSGFNVNTGASGINVQGSPAVARARSGEKVVVRGDPSTYYSHTETREPATITVGGIPYTPDQVVPGTVTGRVSPFNPSGSQGGSYVQGGTSGSQAPFPDVSDPNAGMAQGPTSLITENNPFLTKGSLASQVAQQMSGVQPLPPPPPPAPVAMAQQAQPQGDIVQQQPNQFFGWQGQGQTPGAAMGGSSGSVGASFTPTANTGRTGGLSPGLIGGTPGGYIPPAGSTSPTGGTTNMGMAAPTGSSGSGIYQDQLNSAYDSASQQLGIPGNAIKAIQTLETGGQNYVGQTNDVGRVKADGTPDIVALDSGIFQSTAQSYGLDFNRIVNDPEYAAYATGVVMNGVANSDAGNFKGPSGMTVYQWGEQNLGPGGGWVAVARVYYGGDVTGQFVDELGTRTGEQYGQQFTDYVNQFGGIDGSGSTGTAVQPTGGATTGYQGNGPGGGRDAYGGRGALNANGSSMQPTGSGQYLGSGPGGGRDASRGAINADGTSMQAPPQDSGKAIAANTSDPGMGNAIAGLADDYVGTQYVYGGKTPSGWDCSGFVSYIAGQEGVSAGQKPGGIPDGSHYQYEWAKQRGSLYQVTDVSQLHPGDAIFFNTGAVDDPSVGGNLNQATHVGIYLGNGKFIQALNPDQGTVISVLNDYWMGQVIGATPIY